MSTGGDKNNVIEDFLALDASVGDALQLQDSTPLKHRYHVKLLGYLNQHSLIVTPPCIDDKPISLRAGEEFLVRGFSGAKTYDFDAAVLNVSNTPYPHIHLSFPARVNVLLMRGALRIKVKLPCSVILAAGGIKMPATFNDLSTSGASIQSPVNLGKRGDTIQLNFRVPVDDAEQMLVMSAIIRNVGELQADQAVLYGVEFVGVTNRARTALQTFVYVTLIDRSHMQE